MIRAEQVWLAVEAVDMRQGIDGLSLRIQQALGRSPCDETAYAFRNRAGNRIKLLVWDGTGVWLCVRRLHSPVSTGADCSLGPPHSGRFDVDIDALNPVTARLWWLSHGIICPMHSIAKRVQERPNLTLPEVAAAHICALQSQLAERDVALLARDAELKRRELKIQQLALELAHHCRIRFGSKSEALSPEQRDLFIEASDEDGAAIVAELAQQQPLAAAPRAHKRSGRNPLPPELPRIEHRHEPESCNCDACGRDLVKIGEDISEQLDVEPARFFVHRHIRPQYARRKSSWGTPTAAAKPSSPRRCQRRSSTVASLPRACMPGS